MAATTWCISHSSQFCIIFEPVESAHCPIIQVTTSDGAPGALHAADQNYLSLTG